MVASLSHDLRTPLTTIRAMAHDLTATGDERALMIEEEATRLSAMVTDLLDLSRLTSGASMLAPEPNEAEDLVGAAPSACRAPPPGATCAFLSTSASAVLGRFDFAQTLRVLANLLDNAAKYSPASEPIDLEVRRDGAWLSFSVADRGPACCRRSANGSSSRSTGARRRARTLKGLGLGFRSRARSRWGRRARYGIPPGRVAAASSPSGCQRSISRRWPRCRSLRDLYGEARNLHADFSASQ